MIQATEEKIMKKAIAMSYVLNLDSIQET